MSCSGCMQKRLDKLTPEVRAFLAKFEHSLFVCTYLHIILSGVHLLCWQRLSPTYHAAVPKEISLAAVLAGTDL